MTIKKTFLSLVRAKSIVFVFIAAVDEVCLVFEILFLKNLKKILAEKEILWDTYLILLFLV